MAILAPTPPTSSRPDLAWADQRTAMAAELRRIAQEVERAEAPLPCQLEAMKIRLQLIVRSLISRKLERFWNSKALAFPQCREARQ